MIEDLATLTATTGVRTGAKSDGRSLNAARTITTTAIDSTFIAIGGTLTGEHRSVTRGRAAAALLSSSGHTKGAVLRSLGFPPTYNCYSACIVWRMGLDISTWVVLIFCSSILMWELTSAQAWCCIGTSDTCDEEFTYVTKRARAFYERKGLSMCCSLITVIFVIESGFFARLSKKTKRHAKQAFQ